MRADRTLDLQVDRTPGGSGFDRFNRALIRQVTGLTPFRVPDARLDERIVAAAQYVERKTGLKLFPGTYRCEFRFATLVTNGNYRFRPLVIPGTAAAVTGIMLGTETILPLVPPEQRFSDAEGSLRLYPPPDHTQGNLVGWLTELGGMNQPSLTVDFAAGSECPPQLQELVAIALRWRYDQRKEDTEILERELPRIAVKDAS